MKKKYINPNDINDLFGFSSNEQHELIGTPPTRKALLPYIDKMIQLLYGIKVQPKRRKT